MTNIAALTSDRLSFVSLIGEGAPVLPRLFQSPAFRDAAQVAVHARSVAERNLMAARIDAAIIQADRAVMLVAHGTGCMAAAWWARLSPSSYVSRVAGALLIAPERSGRDGSSFASPRSALPFPSIVVGADDATQALAGEWGSRLIDGPLVIGRQGVSGRFQAMIARFTTAIVERDVATAERLIATIGDR